MLDKLRDERGFVLILVIMLLAAMTAIGTAALMTSNTDMFIARNEKESKVAFYLAETGIEEAVGRMDLSNTNLRFIGETQAQKTNRLGLDGLPNTADDPANPSFNGSANSMFNSATLNLPDIKGTYSVTVTYAREGTDTWCKAGCDNQIVLYGKDFTFEGTGVPVIGYVPVYRIDSVGTTTTGTTATIRAYVTASTLNLIPPAGDIFSNSSIEAKGSTGLQGSVCSATNEVDPDDCPAGCNNVSTTNPKCVNTNMQTYIGIDLNELAAHADAPSPYSQSGPATKTYQEPNTNQWGVVCNQNTNTANINEHVCDNEAKIIYIGNEGAGPARVPGGAGRGVLVVRGELNLSGNLLWEGSVYIMGSLTGSGDITVFGTLMVNSTVNFTGNASVAGSVEVAQSVADMTGMGRLLRWTRL